MGKRIKHVNAKPNEYVKVHRNQKSQPSGGDSDGKGWLILAVVILGFMILVEIVKFIIAYWIIILSVIIGIVLLSIAIWKINKDKKVE